jgi:flagellar protein FlaG
MDMAIAGVGTSVSFTPALDFPKPQHESAEHRAAAEQSEDSGHRKIQLVAADLEHISLAFNKKLQFVVDHRSNEITIKVIDRETDKVIKVLPPEELQRLHSKLRETIGFLFDEWV